jgi:hypothetical protein
LNCVVAVVVLLLSSGQIAKPNTPAKPLPAGAGDEAIAHLDKLRNAKGDLRTAEIRRNMQVRTVQCSCISQGFCIVWCAGSAAQQLV